MLNIYAAQINPTVGNIEGNLQKIFKYYKEGVKNGAHLVITPEGAVTGYPAQDLILRPSFVKKAYDYTVDLAKNIKETALLVNLPMQGESDGIVYNVSLILQHGKISHTIKKRHLFNSGPLDEERVFTSSNETKIPYEINGVKIGFPICQDAWEGDVCAEYKNAGAQLLVSVNASPYYCGKNDVRIQRMQSRVAETGLPLVYLNLMGGQDDVLFDGRSFIINPNKKAQHFLPAWEECAEMVTFDNTKVTSASKHSPKNDIADKYQGIQLGLKDYLRKTGFKKVILGLSGGVDSALVAAIAADTLGKENVTAVLLPSKYSSEHSLTDAKELAENLGITHFTLPIETGVEAGLTSIQQATGVNTNGLAEENIQSRLRGTYLMTLSNATGALLLTTGNKSEIAVGYCTLYGDMNGAYNPIKDLWKTEVYEACKHFNAKMETQTIPQNIFTKAPSAELKPDQRDDDNLPDYETLDRILKLAVEQNLDEADIIQQTNEKADVIQHIMHLLRISEFKRYQGAPGPRLSKTSFGIDRRYPIANAYSYA